MTMRRALLLTTAVIVMFAVWAATTTFGGISWRNLLVVLRTPDGAESHHKACAFRCQTRGVVDRARHGAGSAGRQVHPDRPGIHALCRRRSARLVELASHRSTAACRCHTGLDRHFDHLSTVLELIQNKAAVVLTPPGAAADVPQGPYPVLELPAWQSWEHGGLRVTAVPVLHSGDRLLGDAESHPKAFTGFVAEYRGIVILPATRLLTPPRSMPSPQSFPSSIWR